MIHNLPWQVWPINFYGIYAQLPSPFLGSPLAQGVRQASLRGWSSSHFSEISWKCKQLWTDFSSFIRAGEFYVKYVHDLNISNFATMAVRMNSSWKSYNSQHFQLIWIISKQHNLKYSITWQTPLSFSLCYGSHSPRACKQIWAERLHTFHGYFASFRCSWQTHYGSWYLLYYYYLCSIL